MSAVSKIIIVEGLTDKKQIEKVITDQVTIICTQGTLGIEELDVLIESYDLDYQDVYILTDQDESGLKLRKQLTQELPHAVQMYVSQEYREVATTPTEELAHILNDKKINVHPVYLQFKKLR